MVSKLFKSLLLAASLTAAPGLAAARTAPDLQQTIESAANSRIEYVKANENVYSPMQLEKFTFKDKTWTSKPFTEAEMLNVSCSDEMSIGGTLVQYCVEQVQGKRPTLITKIVSEKSIKPGQKKDVYSKPIMLTLYDFNSDGINDGDIIKTRYRDGVPVNYTMGFNGSVYETWETTSCGEFKVVKSGEGGWFFRAMLGWKRSDLNRKYEKLLHSDTHTAEAKDFAEKFADITRDKIADYVKNPKKCKQ